MELDFNEISDWPVTVKAVSVILLCTVVTGGGYWFFTQDLLSQLQMLRNKEPELKAIFESKQEKAANLGVYEQQMEEVKLSFGSILRQLPSKTEVANLLTDISEVGISTGLGFDLFKPRAEVPAEFYAELPIQIRVMGSYHQFGIFISEVARLPRIVTLHDFTIQHKEGEKLVMEITARTYRYFDQGESPASRGSQKRNNKK
ncbi:pilus assembly protein PilO [Candidatus Nitrosoglobus terrae]|uniref:Pilus assembly protein PilO n=1 Tax=Candidatus Nitrosoglobus terrae TaxID=1630141 RepID=A0A1Q2SPS5_9GAMM|nr:type 4a pilus biogenesis protein PilO [Candidatus Nitrosoglobus terrae]BAW81138.1 pilus assembly protein PilO [Candidatus Nitrosoglobus terrae]